MSGIVYETAHGYTVEAADRGIQVDLITRSPRGDVISTVVMGMDDAAALLSELESVA